jgi:hypothetical protein
MSKSAAQAMNYEKVSLKPKLRTKTTKQIETKTLSKYPVYVILGHLYKRLETEILYTAVCVLFAVIVWQKLG